MIMKYSSKRRQIILQILSSLLLLLLLQFQASAHYYFEVREAPYRRLCEKKNILTVNGRFPGPTIHVHRGDTIYVEVHNKANSNITLHWHGVKQPRNPWTDGPSYITQCPIQSGAKFKQKLIFSDEEGTLWWHAHSTWARATVHGAIFVYPRRGSLYPFPLPTHQFPIILGEWWKEDVREVYKLLLETGGEPDASDALTINGQPGDLFPCSKSETLKLVVEQNKSYLLRIVNAAMNVILFFSVANHKLTVVGIDGSYTEPLTRDYIVISPGQTVDALLLADQWPQQYYIGTRAFSFSTISDNTNTTATAIIQYRNTKPFPDSHAPAISFPHLPHSNDTNAAYSFFTSLRSSSTVNVPKHIDNRIVSTVSINTLPCDRTTTGNSSGCEGPNGTRLAASMNNISFVFPSSIDILEAYYYGIKGVYKKGFPPNPPLKFNFTAEDLATELEATRRGTKVKVVKYGSAMEIVFQGTSLVGAIEHPMHLHGYSFYIVGSGFGNFDKRKDPKRYNLVNPPLRNTAIVPANGWITVRFWATNPGVWFMHCHLERHLTWGMNTVFIVKNGKSPQTQLLPPPPDMPPC